MENARQEKKKNLIEKLIARSALSRRAAFLVQATKKSEAAAKEILYGLPGVFAMRLVSCGKEVRLIKEASELRIMKDSEKSDILLTIYFDDIPALCELSAGETTMQKAFAEGRIHFGGSLKYFATILRAASAGDSLYGEEKYAELYGKGKENDA